MDIIRNLHQMIELQDEILNPDSDSNQSTNFGMTPFPVALPTTEDLLAQRIAYEKNRAPDDKKTAPAKPYAALTPLTPAELAVFSHMGPSDTGTKNPAVRNFVDRQTAIKELVAYATNQTGTKNFPAGDDQLPPAKPDAKMTPAQYASLVSQGGPNNKAPKNHAARSKDNKRPTDKTLVAHTAKNFWDEVLHDLDHKPAPDVAEVGKANKSPHHRGARTEG